MFKGVNTQRVTDAQFTCNRSDMRVDSLEWEWSTQCLSASDICRCKVFVCLLASQKHEASFGACSYMVRFFTRPFRKHFCSKIFVWGAWTCNKIIASRKNQNIAYFNICGPNLALTPLKSDSNMRPDTFVRPSKIFVWGACICILRVCCVL